MIIDATGIVLTPGNRGKNCQGNGENANVECCCDECDYLQCCQENHDPAECFDCKDNACPYFLGCN